MKRRASRLALAAAFALVALSLLTGTAAGASGGSNGAPKSLTHHFPLGSQTLSHTATAGGAATTPHQASATTPRRGSAGTPTRTRTTPAAPTHHAHTALILLVIPALIVVALLVGAARRKGRRRRPGAHVRPWPERMVRSAGGTRWAYVDKDEVEHQTPPLPVRESHAPSLPLRPRPK